MMKISSLGLVSIALLLVGAGCASQESITPAEPTSMIDVEPMTIGIMVPLSGDGVVYGTNVREGVELAKTELQAEDVTLVFEDSNCDAKNAALAAEKLIEEKQVDAIIGDVCSGATLGATPVAEAAGVVLISPGSTAPKISGAGEYIFRSVPSDTAQGAFGAQYAYDQGLKKMAILYTNNDYGVGFDVVLKKEFFQQGGRVVASESMEEESTDVKRQISAIAAHDPDVIYIVSNSPASAAAALKEIRDQDIGAVVMGSEGLNNADVIAMAKEAAEGLIITNVSSGSQAFKKAFHKKYAKEAGIFASQGYDAFVALDQARKTAEILKDGLYQVSFDGVTGPISFDANGDLVGGNFEIWKVKDGKFVQ